MGKKEIVNKEMYKIESEDGSNLLVSKEYRVYSSINMPESARGVLDSKDLFIPQVLIQDEFSRLGQGTINTIKKTYLSLSMSNENCSYTHNLMFFYKHNTIKSLFFSYLPNNFSLKKIRDVYNFGNTLNPGDVNVNNLPLKLDESSDLNSFDKAKCRLSINGGCISIKIIPENSLGGNLTLFKKCLSNVNNTLSSDLACSATILSVEPNETILTLKFLDNNSINFLGMFSSQRIFNSLESDISLPLDNSGSVFQCRKDSFFCELRKIISKDCIGGDSCAEKLYDLPNHNSGVFENQLAVTYLSIYNNIGSDFSSHELDDIRTDLNNYWLQRI